MIITNIQGKNAEKDMEASQDSNDEDCELKIFLHPQALALFALPVARKSVLRDVRARIIAHPRMSKLADFARGNFRFYWKGVAVTPKQEEALTASTFLPSISVAPVPPPLSHSPTPIVVTAATRAAIAAQDNVGLVSPMIGHTELEFEHNPPHSVVMPPKRLGLGTTPGTVRPRRRRRLSQTKATVMSPLTPGPSSPGPAKFLASAIKSPAPVLQGSTYEKTYVNSEDSTGDDKHWFRDRQASVSNAKEGSTRITIIGEKKIIPCGTSMVGSKNYSKRTVTLQQLSELALDDSYDEKQGPTLWISVSNADEATFRALGERFHLHPLTVEDCMSPSESGREKLELFKNYVLLIVQFHYDPAELALREKFGEDIDEEDGLHLIKILVFRNLVLTFHPARLAIIENVKLRLEKVLHNHVSNTSWLLHALLDSIIDSMSPVFQIYLYELHTLEDLISDLNSNEHRDLLKRIAEVRRHLCMLRQSLWSKRDILANLLGKDWKIFSGTSQAPYLRDVYDHLSMMLEKLESTAELLNSLQGLYLGNVSIDVAEISNGMNETMKTLTAVSCITLPLSLIAGLFGMNVAVPFGYQTENDEYLKEDFESFGPFWVICAGLILMGGVLYCMFRSRDMM